MGYSDFQYILPNYEFSKQRVLADSLQDKVESYVVMNPWILETSQPSKRKVFLHFIQDGIG